MKNFDNYGNGINVLVPTSVREAFSSVDDRQVKQVRLFLSAKTKKDAVQVLAEAGFRVRPTDLRIGMGNNLDHLVNAGLLADGAVYVMRQSDYVSAAVVRVDAQGATVVGQMSNDGFTGV